MAGTPATYEPNYNVDGTIKGYVQKDASGAVVGFQETGGTPTPAPAVSRYVGEGGAQYQGSTPVAPPSDAKLSANGMYYDAAGNAYKAPDAASVTRYGSGSVGSMFGTGGAFDTTPVNEQQIRDKARSDVQAQIDAVNELAQSELATARQNATQRLGQTRALGAASGVLGSPTGEAQRQGTEAVNTREEQAIQAAKAEKIAGILAGVNTRADTLVQNAKTAATGNAEKYVAFLKDQATNAKDDMTKLATAGVDLSPDQRTKLLEQTGYNPATFDALYKSIQVANSSAYINKDKPIISADGKTATFIKQVKDPTTGKTVFQSEDVSLPGGMDPKNVDVVSRKDGLYVINKVPNADGSYTTKKVAGPETPAVAPGAQEQLYAGLSPATATAVRSRVKSYASDNTIQNFSTVQDGYNFANSLDTKTKNPADDQALIYSLAKALDPGSVVREGEYATAQKYAQSWVAAYGKGIEQALLGNGFLSQTARENIKKTITQKFNSQKRSYDQTRKSYIQGIGTLTGRNDGEKFITEYQTPDTTDVQSRAASAGYDYQAMIDAGHTDEEITAALDALGG